MRKGGEIIIVEDDADDREIIEEIFTSLGYQNQLVLFENSTHVIEYLERPDVNPFMVISDINMPKMNGFELRDKILGKPDLAMKCIPYIYITTAGDDEVIRQAYKRSVHGLFNKGSNYTELKGILDEIISYWNKALIPAN